VGTSTLTLSDKLAGKLAKLGWNQRRAKEIAAKLSSASKWQPDDLTLKLEKKLAKLGVTEKKAKEAAKALAPTVRATIKLKTAEAAERKSGKTNGEIEEESLDQVATDYKLRSDLPTLDGRKQHTGLELMRVMHGISSSNTYIVAAVRGEKAVIAVRAFSQDSFNVKFYPTMAEWNVTPDDLRDTYSSTHYLSREWYERMYFSRKGLDQLLSRIHAEELANKTTLRKKLKALTTRVCAVTVKNLLNGFDNLYGTRISSIAS
jgi:hypothetical protein